MKTHSQLLIKQQMTPDGYEGMIFCRWIADAIGKAIELDWENFV